MSKTLQLSGDVYSAMLARGFRGEVYLLDDFRTVALDWIMLLVFAALAGSVTCFGLVRGIQDLGYQDAKMQKPN